MTVSTWTIEAMQSRIKEMHDSIAADKDNALAIAKNLRQELTYVSKHDNDYLPAKIRAENAYTTAEALAMAGDALLIASRNLENLKR